MCFATHKEVHIHSKKFYLSLDQDVFFPGLRGGRRAKVLPKYNMSSRNRIIQRFHQLYKKTMNDERMGDFLDAVKSMGQDMLKLSQSLKSQKSSLENRHKKLDDEKKELDEEINSVKIGSDELKIVKQQRKEIHATVIQEATQKANNQEANFKRALDESFESAIGDHTNKQMKFARDWNEAQCAHDKALRELLEKRKKTEEHAKDADD